MSLEAHQRNHLKIYRFLFVILSRYDTFQAEVINYDLLKTMKKTCIIINAARGGIIHEEDLDKALNENLIFGAGIDVFKKEPPDDNNPLLKNEKVYLSPHTAAFTDECMTRMGKETIQNIIDFFEEKLEKSKIVKL